MLKITVRRRTDMGAAMQILLKIGREEREWEEEEGNNRGREGGARDSGQIETCEGGVGRFVSNSTHSNTNNEIKYFPFGISSFFYSSFPKTNNLLFSFSFLFFFFFLGGEGFVAFLIVISES